MDELIKQRIQQDAGCCQVHSIPWDKIRERAFDDTIPAVPFRKNTMKCKIGYSIAAMVVIGGLLIMSGFISPVIAKALEQIPIVKSVFNFYGEKWGLQTAINEKFSTTVQNTATDKDISVTITDVLYDQGRIVIGYTVTTSRPNLYLKDTLPYSIPLPIAEMHFFINGKAIHDTMQGTAERIDNGNVWIVNIYHHGELPESFNLQIAIYQIGDQYGEWLFTVPVSRHYTDEATRTFLPMKTWMIGQTTVIVKQVQICPTDIVIYYQTIQPVGAQLWDDYLPDRVVDDTGHNSYFGPGFSSVESEEIEGNTEIREIRVVLAASLKSMPEYLIFVYPTQEMKVFLN
ncbi:MAG: hypothetical protein A4E52_01741 [Pelotomaculum sp. PtaB.Bin013]|uniref:DUF4179 domain-containing protein n=1 Tax=Pelotomaculum isophthalicicum JI TaxID=947010 RepID=A0A9X4JU15_9FIRM|nr:DUF4179 domain-containing protein [Pelotomaculum isophthalicicum]MDF9408350.1 DUF4179 domain-containing protein [Pelotomaculum isophthalicicum JI]OPX83903.1 MAG: hypothetical protein A4E52_01741 [Pelotomaculum sp. PtaB.Bin013]